LQRIWTHPIVLRLNAEKIEKANEKKGFSSESEGSLKDFINDDSTSSVNSSTSDSDSDNDVQAIDDIKETQTFVPKRRTRNNPGGMFTLVKSLNIILFKLLVHSLSILIFIEINIIFLKYNKQNLYIYM